MNDSFLKEIIGDLSGKGLRLISAVANGRGIITIELDTGLLRTFYLRSDWRIRRNRKNKKPDHMTGFGYFDHSYPHGGITDIHQRLKRRLVPLNGARIKNKPASLRQ